MTEDLLPAAAALGHVRDQNVDVGECVCQNAGEGFPARLFVPYPPVASPMVLDPTLAAELKREHMRLLENGALQPESTLRRHYDTFAARFGPAALRRLDGVELLETLHAHGNKDSLVYWLEFKNDEELPAIFGSIGGGSALKFGLYRRRETGLWMTGSAAQQRELSVEQAVAIARRNRDQLIAAAEVLQQFVSRGSGDYEALQKEIEHAAPDINDSAWTHKYLSLLFHEVLDDYHVPEYQRFHLIKLFLQPPALEGRYVAAGAFVSIARELRMPMNHLAKLLNERHGSPHRYYRVGTSEKERRDEWAAMRDGGFVAIGWPALGNLAEIENSQTGKERVRSLLEEHYPNDARAQGRITNQVFKFVRTIDVGDLVLAADGAAILGIGRIKGDYQHAPGANFCHRRPIEWLSLSEWRMPEPEGLRTTVHELRNPALLIEAERTMQSKAMAVAGGSDDKERPPDMLPPPPLEGTSARIEEVLLRKGQVILYGPPGTGKTYHALLAARELAARSWHGRSYQQLTEAQKRGLQCAVVTCTFHPAYGYEDFLEGFRPVERSGTVGFERRDGIFKQLCHEARRHGKNVYLVIDEINRGDIPRIFGELLTLLEKSKRGMEGTLPLSGEPFSVPENVFVIGTMNTADRSIALLDAALRRRFGFIELMPDSGVLGDTVIKGLPLGRWLHELNERILRHVKRDARNLQIGHTYLMHGNAAITDVRRLVHVVRDDLIPLLEEYCYEDYEALEKILGPSLVQREQRRIDESLFRPGREVDLIKALLAPTPELEATATATASDDEPSVSEEDDGELAGGAAP